MSLTTASEQVAHRLAEAERQRGHRVTVRRLNGTETHPRPAEKAAEPEPVRKPEPPPAPEPVSESGPAPAPELAPVPEPAGEASPPEPARQPEPVRAVTPAGRRR